MSIHSLGLWSGPRTLFLRDSLPDLCEVPFIKEGTPDLCEVPSIKEGTSQGREGATQCGPRFCPAVVLGRLEPPASAYVVRDTGDGLLAAPERWHLWSMPGWQARPPGVSFWFPLGPPGYCGLGVVAQKGPQEPPLNVVRCVRNDALVACGYHPASVPLPTTDRESAESATPAVYRVDNKVRYRRRCESLPLLCSVSRTAGPRDSS